MLCGHRPSRCQSRQPPRGRIRRAVLGPWCTSLTVASPSLCPSQPGCLALLRRCGHPDLEVGFLCCLTPLPGLLVPRVPVSSLAVLLALGSLATSPVVACAGGPAPGLPYTAWFSLFLSVSDTHCVISWLMFIICLPHGVLSPRQRDLCGFTDLAEHLEQHVAQRTYSGQWMLTEWTSVYPTKWLLGACSHALPKTGYLQT